MAAPAFREDMCDVRIYRPKVGMHPNEKQGKYVGKPVHVVWQHPSFSLMGGGGKAGPLHELTKWFGYVVEFDKQVPGDELIHVPKQAKEPK